MASSNPPEQAARFSYKKGRRQKDQSLTFVYL